MESTELYENLLEFTTDCIKLLDLDARVLFMNRGGCKVLEIDDFSLIANACWLDFWKGTDYDAAREAVEAAKAGGIGHFEGYCPTWKGTPKWWDIVITPILGAHGKPERLVASSRDITARKQIEMTLRENDDRLRASEASLVSAQRLAKLGSWQRDDTSGVTVFSDEMLRILGRPDHPPRTLPDFLKCVHPDDQNMVREGALRARANGASAAGEYRIIREDGETRVVRSVVEAIRNEHGTVVGMVGATQDITDLKRAEEESFARQKLETVGTLASGIAHDFNNLLGAAMAQAEIGSILERSPKSPLYAPRCMKVPTPRDASSA